MHFTKICRKIGSALNFNKSIQWSSIDFRSVIATLALIALFGVPSLQAKPIKHVLLVNSYNQQMTWVKNITKGVGEVLQPEINRIEIDIENLNTKVFNSPEYYDQLERYLTTKYKNHPIDLILSSDNNAYNFLRSRRDRIFGPVPMVFSGVNDFSPDQLKSVSNITGVAEIFSAYETVTTALTLHPETKEVFIINDYLTTGRAWERDTAKQLEPLKDKVLLRYAENLTIQELKSQVASLSPNTIVLLGVYFSDRNGESFTYESIGREIANASSRPLYTLLNFNIGHGAIGGKVIGGYSQGAAMASIAMQVLHGITVDQIPVQMTGTNKYVFDYLQLEKFSIKVSNLPPNSVVINKPFSVFEAYKLEIVIFSIIALISIVLALVLISHRHTSALLRVREQHDKAVNLMIKNGGIGLWDWNPQTNMIIHHGSWANRLGYDPSELTMDMKSWIAKFHPDDLEKSRLKVIDFIEGSFSNFRNTYR
ncbi:MAG: ABC transporter substrate binding protein, partial [SAR324 cluster bacterium]|nr:ABC transporter substrate binding protein [SAR324 cluster bacterium]